jgi:hypothetical protein
MRDRMKTSRTNVLPLFLVRPDLLILPVESHCLTYHIRFSRMGEIRMSYLQSSLELDCTIQIVKFFDEDLICCLHLRCLVQNLQLTLLTERIQVDCFMPFPQGLILVGHGVRRAVGI